VGCLLTVDPHHKDGIKACVASLADPSNVIRECSLQQIQQLGPIAKMAEPKVRVLLNDEDDQVRVYAIRAVVALGPEEASVAIVRQLSQRDPDAFVKSAAIDAIEKVTGEKRIRVKEARKASRFD